MTMDLSQKKLSPVAAVESQSVVERNTLLWGMFLVGMVVGFVGVYLIVGQPMFAHLDKVERQVAALQGDMESLVGVKDDVWETNNLLSGLAAQRRQLVEVH